MTVRLAAAAALVSARAFAHDNHLPKGDIVTVCIADNLGSNTTSVVLAELMASKILRPAGVELRWRTSDRACRGSSGNGILIAILKQRPANASPTALARAFVYEGIHIQVFQENVSDSSGKIAPVLLAHVLAHEITHILQGVSRHSTDGLMMARWFTAEYDRMLDGKFGLTAEDIELIHAGMLHRAHLGEALLASRN